MHQLENNLLSLQFVNFVRQMLLQSDKDVLSPVLIKYYKINYQYKINDNQTDFQWSPENFITVKSSILNVLYLVIKYYK